MQPQTHTGPSLDTFGGRLKAIRLARGIRLGQAASKIGLSRTSLGQWENGSVKNPDHDKLIAFTKLADVSLDWLTNRSGDDPDLTTSLNQRQPKTVPNDPSDAPPQSARSADVPEVSASLTAHAKKIDMTARSIWRIPEEVLELGFNATLGRMIIKRVITSDNGDFGFTRGDYLLIDTARNHIDEPGIYLLGDPAGRAAIRVLVKRENDVLHVTTFPDDVNRYVDDPDGQEHAVLGRIMGIFKPA